MADALQIDWVDRMRTDPKANSILNNKTPYETFDTWRFYPRLGRLAGYGMRNRRTLKRRKISFFRNVKGSIG